MFFLLLFILEVDMFLLLRLVIGNPLKQLVLQLVCVSTHQNTINMDSKILQNVKQQSARLIEQLNELEQLKSELEPQEYEELKKDTLDQLKTFQAKLLEIQSGDLSLKTEIQKQFDSIRQAVKSSFNAEEIKTLISGTQISGIRDAIAKMTQDFTLNKVERNTYLREMLNSINALQDAGAELTQDEKVFLSQNTGKQNFVTQDQTVQGNKQLETAKQQVNQNFKQ